jgi:hypothetical protein
MAVNTLEQVYVAARAYLNDQAGNIYTDAFLQPHFSEPYRRMFNCLAPVSKRIQRVVYTDLPAYTSMLIPATVGLTDFSEPEMIEARPALSPITITSTDTSTPIKVTATGHGLGSAGAIANGQVSNVVGAPEAWGNWFVTVIDANTFSLNGSQSQGNAGTGGYFTLQSLQQFIPVQPIDLAIQGIDGQPQSYLGQYMWNNEQLQFRGAVQTQQLRITYWASGTPPSNTGSTIGIDNCIDFLACATAANAARADGFFQLADQLKFTAFGQTQEANCVGGLLGEFIKIQVLTMQRGPQRRTRPFRDKVTRFGNYLGLG